eukprot:TRINITY_DN15401_c0_g1_i1.p1 TRINITY_DN15401_c0_g1~~TRINITY_DN15401_c0_g1_i1.p1  ORF type:complete len:269 (-),score=47.85 TRINITY_DN15401_c0_g1_i1:96-902(-)
MCIRDRLRKFKGFKQTVNRLVREHQQHLEAGWIQATALVHRQLSRMGASLQTVRKQMEQDEADAQTSLLFDVRMRGSWCGQDLSLEGHQLKKKDMSEARLTDVERLRGEVRCASEQVELLAAGLRGQEQCRLNVTATAGVTTTDLVINTAPKPEPYGTCDGGEQRGGNSEGREEPRSGSSQFGRGVMMGNLMRQIGQTTEVAVPPPPKKTSLRNKFQQDRPEHRSGSRNKCQHGRTPRNPPLSSRRATPRSRDGRKTGRPSGATTARS